MYHCHSNSFQNDLTLSSVCISVINKILLSPFDIICHIKEWVLFLLILSFYFLSYFILLSLEGGTRHKFSQWWFLLSFSFQTSRVFNSLKCVLIWLGASEVLADFYRLWGACRWPLNQNNSLPCCPFEAGKNISLC